MTGWNLPPGCNVRDLPGYEDGPCAVCCMSIDDCICPECPTCQTVGDPACYKEKQHLELSKLQAVARATMRTTELQSLVVEAKAVLKEAEADLAKAATMLAEIKAAADDSTYRWMEGDNDD